MAECVCVGVTGDWLPESPADRGLPMLRCARGVPGRSHISPCLPPSAKWRVNLDHAEGGRHF